MASNSRGKVGYTAAIYYNNGTSEVPEWLLLDTVRDVNLAQERSEIDDTSRTTNGFRSYLAGLAEWGADFEMIHNPTNAAWLKIRDSWKANTVIEVLIMNGSLSIDGSIGLRGDVFVTDFSEAQPLDDVISNSTTMKGSGEPIYGSASGGEFVPDSDS